MSLLTTGCGGWARVSGIPFKRDDLRDNEPLETRFPAADRCCWYAGDDGHATVAMEYHNLPLFGSLSEVAWTIGWRLDGMPAGRSRLYRLDRGDVRGIAAFGLDRRRFESRWGVLVLDRITPDRYRGRFHIAVGQQQFSPLTGWAPQGFLAPLLILWGEFEAVRDPARAKRIQDRVDAEDWESLSITPTVIPITPIEPASRPTTTRPDATRSSATRSSTP